MKPYESVVFQFSHHIIESDNGGETYTIRNVGQWINESTEFPNFEFVRKHNSDDNSDIYYTYGMDGFEDALKDNIRIFVEKIGLDVSVDEFSIQVIKGKKLVVPVFGRNTDASLGIYKLTGSIELLNILHMAGIGSRRSEGHGKFEIIG